MVNIDEICQDGEAKYYAAVLFDNAAITVSTGAFSGNPPIKTPDGPLVVYNVYRADEYQRMEADLSLPASIKSKIKSKLRGHNPDFKTDFTTPSLEGWHVLRTPTPLAGDQLRETLTAIQRTLGSQFYSKSLGQLGTVRDSLVMEYVYKV